MKNKENNSFEEILKSIGKGFFAMIKGLFRLLFKVMITFGLYLPAIYVLFGLLLNSLTGFDPFDFRIYGVLYLSGGVACVVCSVIITVRNIIILPAKNAFESKPEAYKEKVEEEWKDIGFASQEKQKQEEEEKKELAFMPMADFAGVHCDYYNKEMESKGEPESKCGYNSDYDLHRKELNTPKVKLDKLLPEYLEEEDNMDNLIIKKERKEASSLLFDVLPDKKEGKKESVMKKVPKKEYTPDIYYSKIQPNILVHEYPDRFELFQIVGDQTKHVGTEYKP